MIWEAVPQCRCSKSERFFTIPCGFDLWYFQNIVVSESPEMIWEAVPQCRCSKSERLFTIPCGFDLWYFQNVVVSERIFRVFHMDKIMKTERCKFINYFICFQSHGSHSSNLQGRHLSFL